MSSEYLPEQGKRIVETTLYQALDCMNYLATERGLHSEYNRTIEIMDSSLAFVIDDLVLKYAPNYDSGKPHPDAGPLSYGLVMGTQFAANILTPMSHGNFNTEMTQNLALISRHYFESVDNLEDVVSKGGSQFIGDISARLSNGFLRYAAEDSLEAERSNRLYRNAAGYMGAAALSALVRDAMILFNEPKRNEAHRNLMQDDEAWLMYLPGDSADEPAFDIVQHFE